MSFSKKLPHDIWRDRDELFWCRIPTDYRWGDQRFKNAEIWLDENTQGWVFLGTDNHTFFFEFEEDIVLFRLWIQSA